MNLVVADDNPIIREGVTRILERGGMSVVAAAADADELLEKVATLRPDVVIADIEMPPHRAEDGLQAAVAIRKSYPGIGVIVLSQYLEDDYALSLVGDRPEGVGYLLKEKIADTDVVNDAVRRVAAGEAVLDPDVITRLVRRRGRGTELESLTPRERDVLTLMAQGRSNTGIAEDLVVTVAAVERHITNIFAKLGLQHAGTTQHRRVLAVLAYLKS
ncbi:response regulator transcription factor [Mycobacterium sherrisii]|uniref:response regulator transcription factor n=1 Tax=Mycobacterium sherrisii TaxID=243061 RepID=UPI0018DEC462